MKFSEQLEAKAWSPVEPPEPPEGTPSRKSQLILSEDVGAPLWLCYKLIQPGEEKKGGPELFSHLGFNPAD